MMFRFLPTRWWSPKSWRNWSAYVRWRMETYGVFYPANRFNSVAFLKMLRQLPAYRRWLVQFDRQKH